MIKNKGAKSIFFENLDANQEALLNTLREASKKIAPVWPLENFVAVNPYLGFTNEKFDNVAQKLAAAGAVQMTLPASFYLEKLNEGEILEQDLATVLSKRGIKTGVITFVKTIENNLDSNRMPKTIASVAELATEVTEKDWNRFVTDRV